MSTLPQPTKELYHNIRAEVIGLHYRVKILRQLFTSQEIVDLLNKTAFRFFTTLRYDLLDTIVLAINRLLDPAKTFNRYPNASLQQLIDQIDIPENAASVAKLRDTLCQIKCKSHRLENWRDKWAGHRDLDVLLGNAPLPAISLVEVDEVLVLLQSFMNEFEETFQDPLEEVNLYGKTDADVKEIAKNLQLRIPSPTDYGNMCY